MNITNEEFRMFMVKKMGIKFDKHKDIIKDVTARTKNLLNTNTALYLYIREQGYSNEEIDIFVTNERKKGTKKVKDLKQIKIGTGGAWLPIYNDVNYVLRLMDKNEAPVEVEKSYEGSTYTKWQFDMELVSISMMDEVRAYMKKKEPDKMAKLDALEEGTIYKVELPKSGVKAFAIFLDEHPKVDEFMMERTGTGYATKYVFDDVKDA